MYNNLKIQNTRILNNILGFWGSIFSNFHIHNFKYENIWFPSSEHAFMWKKADYFQDDQTKWKGQNLLGKALMEVRETLKNKALEKYFPTKESS